MDVEILDQFRNESRFSGCIQKEQFLNLLNWWHPANPDEVSKPIPGGVGGAENSFIDLLKEYCGTGAEKMRKWGEKLNLVPTFVLQILKILLMFLRNL